MTSINRSQFGDVHGSVASHNVTMINVTNPPENLFENLSYHNSAAVSSQERMGYAASLRAPPNYFFGRDEEKSNIVQTLLHSETKSALILGGGGIGKTAVALMVLHDQAVIDHFGGSRCFVNCEGLDNMEMFLQRLSEILGLATLDGKRPVEDGILSVLSSSNCLLCIDNLETIWDSPDTSRTEEIIAKLIHLPRLAVLVTMRGIERPLEPKWETVHELKPLSHLPSIQVFFSAAGMAVDTMDEYGKLLVDAADGVPLVLNLLGHLLRSGVDTPKDIWRKWMKRKTSILSREKGSRNPHLSVDTSIEFSLECQRVTADPFAKVMLGILSLLPAGIPRDSDLDIINGLESSLPGEPDLERSLSTLRDVALAFVVDRSPGRRYQILSPVREYAHKRLEKILPCSQQIIMVKYFLTLMHENRHISKPSCFPIQEELVNIHSILSIGYKSLKDDVTSHDLVHASIAYTNWTVNIGVPVEDIILLATNQSQEDSQLLSHVYFSYGKLYWHQDKLFYAEKAWKDALDLHHKVKNLPGEADSLQRLGDLYMRLDRLDSAEKALTDALNLHHQVQSSLGEANDLQSLGDLYMRLDRLDSAEKALTNALDLHRQVQDSWGEANDLQSLGDLYMRLDRLDSADKALTNALDLHHQVQSSLGEANDLQSLGDLYMRLDRLDSAEKALKDALDLHHQVQSLLGEANDLQKLGDLYIRLDRPGSAEKALKDALDLHRQVQDSLGEANDLQSLGNLYIILGRFDSAEKALTDALDLYHQVQSSLGEANILQRLGDLYMKLGRLGSAEKSLKDALDLHCQVQSSLGEANDLRSLGDLYLRLDRFDSAEKALKDALDLHHQVQSSLGEGNDLRSLGDLYMRLDRLDSAEKALTDALDLHRQVQDILGEANDLQRLGNLYMKLDRLDSAEKALKDALDLHCQVQSSLEEANDLQRLGNLYMKLDRFDSAEKALTDALDLHHKLQDSQGEVCDLCTLGNLHINQKQFGQAENLLTRALQLSNQIDYAWGCKTSHELLEQVHLQKEGVDDAEISTVYM